MQGDIAVCGSRSQILPQHENGFAMRDRTGADEPYVSSDRDIAGETLPREVHGVLGPPDIRSAAGDAILARSGVVGQPACLRGYAEIAVRFEEAPALAGY